MSNKTRYKIGDELKATLVITEEDEYDDEKHYTLVVKGLPDADIDNVFTQEELDQVFNRAFIKRKLQADIDKATKLLEEMNNNDA